MSQVLDPRNPVARVFYLRAKMHWAKAPEPPVKEVKQNQEPPNIAAQYANVKVTQVERWYAS